VRTRIKICGITRTEDAVAAAAAGADAIGLVFYAPSARAISLDAARGIGAAMPAFVARVGVFLNAKAAFVRKVLTNVPLDVLQFHGEEPPDVCESFGRPYIKAIAMGGEADIAHYMARYPGACGFLLDSHLPGQAGGSGTVVNWAQVPLRSGRSLILAGGLNVDNVALAMRSARPYGVDISSGVERAKGIKDVGKIAAFINEVKRVDSQQE
jgi:phosphoribosylanthranilate isomerase